MSKPIYRHLAERSWRKEGDLAILVRLPPFFLLPFAKLTMLLKSNQMQRVTQMSVTPDLLPRISPVADVRISIGGTTIVPGVFTLPSSVRIPFEFSS